MTTCPKSNSFVSADMKGKEITDLLAKGIEISVNSDDPAYFGGYISENYWPLLKHMIYQSTKLYKLPKIHLTARGSVINKNGIMFKKL
ncbi:hypothetical protein [Leuconostoc falkenbergense]|uniref:hypothetical protein n=1 Tax=Leuconostoc falkenbergense TaxID=2766470 RepID=UPI002445C0F5|nr:hypothetical protein [Leuconostoc falkenbergense]